MNKPYPPTLYFWQHAWHTCSVLNCYIHFVPNGGSDGGRERKGGRIIETEGEKDISHNTRFDICYFLKAKI